MEQVAIFLLGVHLGLVQLIKSTGPIQQLTMFPLGFIYQIPRPHGTITDIRISSMVYINPKTEKREKADMHEVRRGFTFPTDFSETLTWNIGA